MDLLDKVSDKLEYLLGERVNFSYPTEVIDYIRSFNYSSLPKFKFIDKSDCVKDEPFVGYDEQVFCKGNVKIQAFCTFTGSIVFGNNVHVGPYCFLRGPLIVGDNVHIGPGAEMSRSVLLDNTIFGHRNIILDSIIGERANVSGLVNIHNVAHRMDGRQVVQVRYKDKKVEYAGRYGCTIENDVYIGANMCVSPGAYLPPHGQYFGPGIIYGLGKSKLEVESKTA